MDLVGTAEIADLFGVTRQRAWQLTQDPTFPEPVAALSAGKFWHRRQVERWGRDQGRFMTTDQQD